MFTVLTLAEGIARVKGNRQSGVRTGNWLTREQASLLLRCPDAQTLKGKRDRILVVLLKVYDLAGDEKIRKRPNRLIATEDDAKYQKKYMTVWGKSKPNELPTQ